MISGRVPEGSTVALARPFTLGSFKKKLQDFEELIQELTLQGVEASPEERRQLITENLRFDQFCDSIRALFGGDVRNAHLKTIYRKISANPDAKVDWSELFGYFQAESDELEVSVGEEVNVFTMSARRRVGEAAGDRKRRDIVVSIQYAPAMDCYITASQKGAISVYTSKFRLQACTDINESAWVTGCDYLPRMKRIVTCTERSICVWDSRAKGKAQAMFLIKPIEHSPQCLTSVPHPTRYHNEDVLIYGDDQGYVNLVTLSTKDFAPQNAKDSQRFGTAHTVDPNKLLYPIRRRKIHEDWVLKVKWFPELQCFGSCSPSSSSSFVLEEVNRLLDDGPVRSVSVLKGVNAFDYCARANVIATGGVDKVIRVWHPHIFTRPTGKLIGHLFTIVDIVCNDKDQHIISLSTARVIRVWDMHTLTSLQVFTDNEERPGEKRIYSMLYNDKHEHLLTGSSVLDAWPLTRAVQDTLQVPHTHDRPISQILYNSEVNQVITVCAESVIRVWEAETGKAVYHITDAHGPNTEVSALCVDRSGYRMATGATDGSVKVWDFGSGHQIKHKIGRGTDDELIINGLFYCTVNRERALVVQGWNNKLRLLKDSNEGSDMPLLREFNDIHYMTREVSLTPAVSTSFQTTPLPEIGATRASAQITSVFKKKYILSMYELTCMTALLPDICATGCDDGSVIFWHLDNSSVDKILTIPGQENTTPKPLSRQRSKGHLLSRGASRGQLLDNSKRINALRFLVHKVRRLDPAYLKKLRAAHVKADENSDEEADGATSPRRHRRTSRTTTHTQSRTSINNIDGHNSIEIDQSLLNELTTRIEGEETLDEVKSATIPAPSADQATVKDRDPDSRLPPTDPDTVQSHASESKLGSNGKTTSDIDDLDPESKILVDTYDPVLVTCHSDSIIRFWNLDGDFLRDISAVTRRQGSAVTALCTDPDCHLLLTGDSKGYVTLWDIAEFLKEPQKDDLDAIKQVICWRAHTTRIIQLEYLATPKAILTGATDGSVRIWWGDKGKYVGFIGQPRPFHFPTDDDATSNTILPYDITEGPLAPIKIISAKTKLKAQTQRFEYPLIFDNQRWRPFRRSAHMSQRQSHVTEELQDKKFFGSLIKPRPVRQSMESSTTGETRHGAVFRALPVYRVHTPARLKTPDFTRGTPDSDMPYGAALMMTSQPQKGAKASRHSTDRLKKSRPRRGSVMVPSISNHGNISSRAPSGAPQLSTLSVSTHRR